MGQGTPKERSPGENSSSPAIPWSDLWKIANDLKESEVHQLFAGAIWSLRVSEVHAAVISTWLSVVAKLLQMLHQFPPSVFEFCEARTSNGKSNLDGKELLRVCRKLSVFGMKATTTTYEDQNLKELLELRNNCAHLPRPHLGLNEVASRMIQHGRLFLLRPSEESKMADAMIIHEIAKKSAISLGPPDAKVLSEMVPKGQLFELCMKLLDEFLLRSHAGSISQSGDGQGDNGVEGSEQESGDSPYDWMRIDANVATVWEEVFERLKPGEKIRLLRRLKHEYADCLYCDAKEKGDVIELVPKEKKKRKAIGRRQLGELAILPIWKRGVAPTKYYRFFYKCFVKNAADLATLPDWLKNQLWEHAPDEYRDELKEAFYGPDA